jgi:Right handed beta helix region
VSAYPGEEPVLDLTGFVAPEGSTGVVDIEDGSDLAVTGLTITGYRTTSQGVVPMGIFVRGATDGLTLAGNHVHDLGNDNDELGSFDTNAHGIAVYGTDPRRPVTGLRIVRNEVDHLVLGASESVVVNGNVAGWRIVGNHIHHNNNIGIDAIGYERTLGGDARWTDANRARDGLIARNLVTDIVSEGNPAYWDGRGWCNCADGIYVDGGLDITIRDNVVRRSDIGIEAASEWPRGGTERIRIRHNTVTASRYTGLAIGGYGPGRGDAGEIEVTRNVLRGNNQLDDGSPEILLQFKVHDTRIVGNRITATHAAYPLLVARVRRAGTPEQNARVRLDRNRYGVPPGTAALFGLADRVLRGLPSWRAATGQDRHSRVRPTSALVREDSMDCH